LQGIEKDYGSGLYVATVPMMKGSKDKKLFILPANGNRFLW
jgi:hypothetical protein